MSVVVVVLLLVLVVVVLVTTTAAATNNITATDIALIIIVVVVVVVVVVVDYSKCMSKMRSGENPERPPMFSFCFMGFPLSLTMLLLFERARKGSEPSWNLTLQPCQIWRIIKNPCARFARTTKGQV